ncbi:unnamed protein product [Heterobilharzia americana]|nr:unnamed protein product [Heterobilharzia americana]
MERSFIYNKNKNNNSQSAEKWSSNANEISDDNQNKTLAPAINTGRRNGYEERGGSTEYVKESESMRPNLFPADESASRDLDNASPRTVALCSRYPCHYCFFVYFPSSTVDDDIIPFQRKAFMDKVALLQNPEHIKEVKETKCARDAFSDRRIRSIERHSGTQVHLSELDPGVACVKGLPRRRLTIAGPTFVNICCALNLLEDLLPGVIKGAVFPYRLPEGSSTRFQAGSRMSSVIKLEKLNCS